MLKTVVNFSIQDLKIVSMLSGRSRLSLCKCNSSGVSLPYLKEVPVLEGLKFLLKFFTGTEGKIQQKNLTWSLESCRTYVN